MAIVIPQEQYTATNDRIIEYLAAGLTAKEIADKVGLKPRGVEKRIAKLRKDYNARSATQLVASYKGFAASGPSF